MPDLVPVDVEGVIVEAGVPHQPVPLVPTLGDVVAIVLVEVFAEVAYTLLLHRREEGKNTIIYHDMIQFDT